MHKKTTPTALRVIRELILRYFGDLVGRSAAELAYYLFFSLFPTLIFMNSAISMLHLSADSMMENLNVVLPAEAVDIITTYLSYIQGLDTHILFIACLFLAVYVLTRSVTSLMRSVSNAYRMPRRGVIGFLVSMVFTVLLLLSLFLLLAIMMVSGNLLEKVNRYITVPMAFIRLWSILRLTVAPLYMCLVLSCFYFVVGYKRYRFWQALPGAGFSVVLWFLATSAFSYYITNISRYSLMYGSLAAVMVLMLWFYISGVVVIIGGELNHILAEIYEEKKQVGGK